MLFAELTLLAVSRGVDTAGVKSLTDEEFLGGIGSAVAKREIVFLGSAFIRMPLDRDPDSGSLRQGSSIRNQCLLGVLSNAVLIVIEEGILDA